ncbi:leucine-rich repeat neuronal protein 4 [Stegastes partitus]|uniref:LRRN4 C-terminal like n=1 Tax=Stegastes partitus TaxID=144197 RepID=A0A3B5A1Y9_9TELE|nr:PREDICTED: LRRN4 C-terminal-like protein [Stegastes partitus]
MTSLCRNLATLLLFISPLMLSHLFTHAASTSPPITRPRIIFMTGLDLGDDYGDDYADSHSSPPKILASMRTPLLHQGPSLCQYDPCLEDQEPCARLTALTGCRCPGMSGADEPPHPPRIAALLPVSDGKDRGKIEVQWCAPSSVVSAYRVVVEGSDSGFLEYGNALRRGVVGSLEVGTKVCVEAVNSAGQSATSEFSCKRYEAPESSDDKLLAWIIGGGVALLLLIVITAVILWKCQICRKAKRDSADGLGNPSYSTEGTL